MKALTIGGAMIDTIAIIESDMIERMSMKNAHTSFLLIEEGQKTEARDISTHTGGGAVNAAVSLARLGAKVSTLLKLGQDDRAKMVLEGLRNEGINTDFVVQTALAPTGSAVMIASHERNAGIFTFRGANTLLESCDLKNEAFKQDLVYISTLSNKSADVAGEILDKAEFNNAFTVINPGIRQLSKRGNVTETHLNKIDLLAINRVEAESILPRLIAKYGDEVGAKSITHPLKNGGFSMSLERLISLLTSEGARFIVITDGKDGAYLGDSSGITHCPIVAVKVAGTAGAGDAFNSTLALFLAEGKDKLTALKAASHNAASVVSVVDTQSGLLRRAELEMRLKEKQ